jgi:thiol-disulfide isomerase/thioredoxin
VLIENAWELSGIPATLVLHPGLYHKFIHHTKHFNMKKLQFLMIGLVAMLCAVSGQTQDSGIQFHQGNWSEALASAEKENKLIFVDCFTDWCGPCKWMAANVMTDPDLGKFFNEHFINVGIDMEKGEGLDLAKKYNIRAYPTLMFLNAKGELVHKVVGARQIPDFLAMGQMVANGIEPISKLEAQFATGEYDREWLYQYLIRLSDAGSYDSLVTSEFEQYMNGAELLSVDSWDIFKRIYRRTDSPQFLYVLNHLTEFEEKFGKKDVNLKLHQCYSGAIWKVLRDKDFTTYESMRKDFSRLHLEDMDAQLAQMDIQRYKVELEPVKYHKKAAQLADKYLQDNSMILNNLAWEFYEASQDKKMLAKAVKWAERSIELEKGYPNMDTYGFLLFKTGQDQKAQEVLAEAIELAKAEGTDYSATENDLKEWLERIKE